MMIYTESVCALLNASKISSCNVFVSRLRWAVEDTYGELKAALESNGNQPFDVIVAADCLFFKEFHDGIFNIFV